MSLHIALLIWGGYHAWVIAQQTAKTDQQAWFKGGVLLVTTFAFVYGATALIGDAVLIMAN